jgi:lipid II:glycine glycyltransferase (peptidoglycan interpeptide bridge formation enzyme)
MREDLLTIKEFSELAGVSQQALYQRLNKSLQEYVVVIDNKKHLKREALSLFERTEQSAENKAVEQGSINVEQELFKALQDTIAMLQEQLKAKDQQIAELNERLRDAMEISKAHIVITAADKQLPPTQEEIQEAETAPEIKPGVFGWFKNWWN